VEVVGVDIAPPLAICPDCERSLVVIEGRARLATAADVTDITPDDKAALSQLRIDTRRARKAYYQQHHR
jgi:hypothetical protein